ncbi:MAG: hypothetical protein ACREFP_04515 [Acetobacteraceae bacterium]
MELALDYALAPGPPAFQAATNSSAEHLLLDAAGRAARSQGAWAALVLHLGRFGPPAPEPHHRRIARALLTEAAQRHDGQLFALGNGDLVLLCRPSLSHAALAQDDPASLQGKLVCLFGAETSEPDTIVSLWPLPGRADLLLHYAAERFAAAGPPGPSLRRLARVEAEAFPVSAAPAAGLVAALPGFPELLQRRTGVLVAWTDRGRTHTLSPLFREIAFSPAALWARCAPPNECGPDAWLLRHFTHRLDDPLLALLEAALPGSGPIGMAGTPPDFALHLNLSAKSVVKERCAHLFDTCRSMGVAVGVEVSLVEVAAAPEALAAARTAVRSAGNRLVLGGISHQALLLIRPGSLDADLFKLDWSPRIARLAAADHRRLVAALGALGPERVILSRADNEAAVLWGLGSGIRRFVGQHVEVMLAAGRMLSCPAAQGCTLGQCKERAASAVPSGRRFCRNLVLLDSRAAAAGLG